MKEVIFGVVLTLVVTFIIFGGAVKLDSISCENVGEQMALESSYKVFGGCFLKINGKWVSTKFIRDLGINELTKEKN